jgi:hypothetical protein
MGLYTIPHIFITASALLVLQQSAYPLHAFQALENPRTSPASLDNQYDTLRRRRTATHGITTLCTLTSPNEQDQDVKQGGPIDGVRRLFTVPRKNNGQDGSPNLLDAERRGGVLEPRDPIPYQIKYQSNTRVRTASGGVTILNDGGDEDNASNGAWGSIKDAFWDRVDGINGSSRSQVRPPRPLDGYGDLFDPRQSTTTGPSQMNSATSQGAPPPKDQYSLGLTPGARVLLQQQQRAQEMKGQAPENASTAETTDLFNSIFSLPKEEPQGPFASLKDSIYDRLDSFTQKNQDKANTRTKSSPASKYNPKAGSKPLQNAEADTTQLEARRQQEESSRKFETAKVSSSRQT